MGAFDLGKYLADAGVNLDTEKAREQIEYISIDLIVPDPNNFYELSGLDDLASNIALCGLQQPLRVRPMPGDESQVVILSGHRRHAALKMLIDEGRDDLRDVPCIVEYGEEKPELTQLKLIYANASTRVITDAEKARQAEQVEKLLYALKESGMEFPGRMRDHVAAVCKISTGKIAQLKFLKEQLIPAFLELWENGTLKNDTANAIAHMSQRHQQIFYNVISPNAQYRMPAEWVKRIGAGMEDHDKKCEALHCEEGGTCYQGTTRCVMMAKGNYCYGGCCKTCSNLSECKSSCPMAVNEKFRLKAKAREQRKAAKAAQRTQDEPERDFIRATYSRVGQLRQARGISKNDYLKTSQNYAFADDVKKLDDLEAGKKISLQSRMPGGIWPREARNLCKVADLLGCSIDYLLGRTDAVNSATSGGTGWQTGTPEKSGLYITVVTMPGAALLVQRLEWDGKDWRLPKLPDTKLDSDMKVAYWIAMPEI